MYGRRIAAAASRLVNPDAVADLRRLLPDGHAGQTDMPALKLHVRAILAKHVHHGVLRPALIDTYQAGWAAGEHAAHDAIRRLAPSKVDDRLKGVGSEPLQGVGDIGTDVGDVAKSDTGAVVDRLTADLLLDGSRDDGVDLLPKREVHESDSLTDLRPLAKADRSSGAELSSAGPVVNWDTWTPGNAPAAQQAQDLESLISDAVGSNDAWATRAAMRGNLLASIEDTRLSVLADKLSAALEQGATVDQLDKVLQSVLTDTSWSEMVATTEMNRAMTAASQLTYQNAGIPARACMTAEDQRVCNMCAENEDAGPVPFGSDFPNGSPPTHPLCRCAVVPDWLDVPVTPADMLGASDFEG